MKKLYYAIGLMLILSIVSTCVILILAPDVIPAHYNSSGEVDRFGSKYEQLIFPAFGILMTAFLLTVLRFEKKRGMPEMEQRIVLYTILFSLLLFTGLGLFFGIAAIRYGESQMAMQPQKVTKLVGVGTGVILILFGNIMPKARRNAFFGLRTKWSMASDEVWRKSQRFGGFTAVVCGLMMAVIAVVLPGTWSIAALTAGVLLWVAVSVAASYRYWKAAR